VAAGGVRDAIMDIAMVIVMDTGMGVGPDTGQVIDLAIETLPTIISIVHSVIRHGQELSLPQPTEGRQLHVPRPTGPITFTLTRRVMSTAKQIRGGRIVLISNGSQQKVIRTWLSNRSNSKRPGQRKLSSGERRNKPSNLIAAVRQGSRVVIEPAVIIVGHAAAGAGAVRVVEEVAEVVAADDKQSEGIKGWLAEFD